MFDSSEAIEARLAELWNCADKIGSGSEEYDEIVDEVLALRSYCRENHIALSDSISARF